MCEDRILHETYATGGDVRRICDLFSLSTDEAARYPFESPDLRDNDQTVRRT